MSRSVNPTPSHPLLTLACPSLPQCYRDLALVSRDGMNAVLNKMNQILMEKYLKLQDTGRTQVRRAHVGVCVCLCISQHAGKPPVWGSAVHLT